MGRSARLIRMERPLLVTGSAIAVLLAALAGCGQGGTGSPGPSGTASPPGSASPTPVQPSPGQASPGAPSPGAPSPGASPGGPAILTGTTEEGVSPGCLILSSDSGGKWTLTGKVAGLRAGARIAVAGHEGLNMASHCQQGRIFVVTSVKTG
ncbi:MAG: hypothetical protein QOD41_2235 [Cryptosporangiaceae bacterium]|nr:hypothetical protein [Cryptosporangiaceae bacterium]